MTGAKATAGCGVALALWLAVPPATGAPPRCREVPAADALRRLEVWGREWTAGRGPVTARANRRVAVLAGRDGAMLEALYLVALDEAGGACELSAEWSHFEFGIKAPPEFRRNRASGFSAERRHVVVSSGFELS